MSFQFTLQKVLQYREREKNTVQAKYQEAVDQFEVVATQLYELLKRKEDIEKQAREQVSSGTSIYSLQQSQMKLLRLQHEIQVKQRATQVARENMHVKEQDFISKSIEVKKYEKMKEIKHEQYKAEEKRLELLQMDELSIRLFANR
ncbi:flagellar export protein FliJ [Halalkalibacter akibai]|uniref:Flagellar FliJ protein n=1 Tax=Halalkalibacter akibai (strain ATCC 43226 / DSM 21942 / CIP 109018 / JCM 9157 / 1139) TaxID=1236973 RepID=W4QVV8_HALA3|nr:flagellar export protein FliJ [Halalkalibacter akibai]GAE36027.1 flagellar protein FliJ [Halalkalibacter akibai JCM 9157]